MNAPELSNDAEHFEEEVPDAVQTAADLDSKRLELIRLSEEGEISQSVKHIRKASDKIINKIFSEHEHRLADKTNTALADTLITQYAELLCGLDLVDEKENLTRDLRNDKLLQRNIKTAVSFITPFIPFMGMVSGGVTTGRYMAKRHMNRETEEDTIDES